MAGSQGNRFQQFQPSWSLRASPRLSTGMCAAEVDHHVAQRYVIKRRLGKGVSPGKRPGDRGTWPPTGRGQGQCVCGGSLFPLTLRGLLARLWPPPRTGAVPLGKPPSPNSAYSQQTCQVPGSGKPVATKAPKRSEAQ